jgi:hypothetical protein
MTFKYKHSYKQNNPTLTGVSQEFVTNFISIFCIFITCELCKLLRQMYNFFHKKQLLLMKPP